MAGSDENVMAGISYLGCFCCAIPSLIIFLMKKDTSNFVKFASLQAMGFFLANFLIAIVFMILSMIPVIGMVTFLIHTLICLGALGYVVFLAIQAFRGEETEIPYLGDLIRSNLM